MKSKDGWSFTGKDVGVILTYGDSDVFGAGGVNALHCFQDIFAYEKANYVGAVYGTASKPGDVKSDEELLESAFSLGERMVKPS
jgi:hypothetical protein